MVDDGIKHYCHYGFCADTKRYKRLWAISCATQHYEKNIVTGVFDESTSCMILLADWAAWTADKVNSVCAFSLAHKRLHWGVMRERKREITHVAADSANTVASYSLHRYIYNTIITAEHALAITKATWWGEKSSCTWIGITIAIQLRHIVSLCSADDMLKRAMSNPLDARQQPAFDLI